jgi:hypothetical protein
MEGRTTKCRKRPLTPQSNCKCQVPFRVDQAASLLFQVVCVRRDRIALRGL